MNHLKDRKPNRPDIQEILSRMKNRFINEEESDNEDQTAGENEVSTCLIESCLKEELLIPIEKSPDDEIAELMLKLNGQVDEELVASIRSRKKLHENHSEVDSTSSTTNNSTETEESVQKPRIILTLRPNENKPDSYVSSSNLTDYSSNSPKRKKQINNVNTEILPLKRSSRRSNDINQSVLKSAIARKERTFSIDVNSKKRSPKKIKKELDVTNIVPENIQPLIEGNIKNVQIKEERTEESIADQKKKKKKFFRGGRYNIFKKKPLQKVKKGNGNQINSDSTNFDLDTSETNSERHSISVCSDMGTLVSSDRNYQDDLETNVSNIDIEDRINDTSLETQDAEINLCLCYKHIQVIVVDEGKITCKADDCVDGVLITCKRLAYHLDEYGNMPMFRANVALPFLTFCAHHMKRFSLHHSCPRCGRFCSEGIFMMCKNNHFFHIGCYQKDKGCLHCGSSDVYDLELRRHIINLKKSRQNKKEYKSSITVEIGKTKLTTLHCPPEINVAELGKHLQQLKDEIANTKRIVHTVNELYQACESNDIKKVLSILGSGANPSHRFPSKNNQTALHVACSQGNLMLVYLLLQVGVDPNQADDKMKTPLRMAAKSGHSDIVQYLINRNGAPEIKDSQGMTSLHLAAKNGKLECCKLILSKRPSMVNWKDNGGWTPLVWACENSHTNVVKYFITHNPNTRIPDDENNVALHWAAISGCLGVVQGLVEYDSEVNMLNDAGDTALHIATRKNATNIVSFLLEKGAMAWHRNKWKKRPIDYCITNTECYDILKNVPPEQRKPVGDIKPLVNVDLEYSNSELETAQTSAIFIKTTPVLISEDITHGCEDVPIRCVNEIDDEVPVEFTYIKENCYDVGNYVDSAMSHIASCNCDGACNTSDCKCVQANGDCLYDENGCLNSEFDYFNPSVILYECNLRCRCHKQRCGNRVIQKGIKVELELYRHQGMGWGVRSRQLIPRGTFVCEYVGEIITDQKANDLKEDSYLFNLENPGATELYCIDAFNYSNVSRFINHSCDPNLMSVRSFINHHDKRFPRIAFFAVQDIKEFEPLSYDYGTAFWKVKGKLFTCKCGKANCSFSEEAIKNLHIDSDNEEMELDGNVEQSIIGTIILSNNSSSDEDNIETNEAYNNSCHKLKLSKSNNLSTQNNSLSNIRIPSENNFLKNNSKLSNISSTQKNGLVKNKSVKLKVVKKKEPKENVKQFLKRTDLISTLFENKLEQVMLKKGIGKNFLTGKSKDKTIWVTRKKSSTEAIEEKKMGRSDIVPSGSVKSTRNKVVTTYVLRPEMSNSNKEISVNSEVGSTVVSKGIVLRSRDFGNKKTSCISVDTRLSSQEITQDSSEQMITCIETEPTHEDSCESAVNGMENEYNLEEEPAVFPETSGTFDEEYLDVKSNIDLDFSNSCKQEPLSPTSQDDWSSSGSLNDLL